MTTHIKKEVRSILITPDATLIDDGKGEVAHLLPQMIKVLLPDGRVVELEKLLPQIA